MTGPRVIVPFTETNGWGTPNVEVVNLALTQQGVLAEFVNVGRYDSDYYELLATMWNAKESFIVVEHDVVPWFGVLQQMWDCPKKWCSMPYLIIGQGVSCDDALGCSKFSVKLIAKHPDLVDSFPDPNWRSLDRQMNERLRRLGLKPHRHDPPGIHLHASHQRMAEKTGWLDSDFPPDADASVLDYVVHRKPWPAPNRRRLFQFERPVEEEVYSEGGPAEREKFRAIGEWWVKTYGDADEPSA